MSQALKCDRCGVIYVLPPHEPFQAPSKPGWTVILPSEGRFWVCNGGSAPFLDLCGDCSAAFTSFMEGRG